jgi:hypothetical protein
VAHARNAARDDLQVILERLHAFHAKLALRVKAEIALYAYHASPANGKT